MNTDTRVIRWYLTFSNWRWEFDVNMWLSIRTKLVSYVPN